MNEMEISINGVNGQHLITGIAENDVIQTVSATSTNRGKYFVYVGKNKSITISFANHYGYENALYQANLTLISGTNYSESLGEHVNFTGNTSATIHTGNYEYVMFQCDHQTAYTATFTDISDDIKLVNGYELDNNLTSIANAIRTKSGGSSSLVFPTGFVSEIGNIPTGGNSLPNVVELIIGNFPDKYLDPGTSAGSVTFSFVEHWTDGGWKQASFQKTISFTAEQGYTYYLKSRNEVLSFMNISTSDLHMGYTGWYYDFIVTNASGLNNPNVMSWMITEEDNAADTWKVEQATYAYNYSVIRPDAIVFERPYPAKLFYNLEASWEDD